MIALFHWVKSLRCRWTGHDYVAAANQYSPASVCCHCGHARRHAVAPKVRPYLKRKAG